MAEVVWCTDPVSPATVLVSTLSVLSVVGSRLVLLDVGILKSVKLGDRPNPRKKERTKSRSRISDVLEFLIDGPDFHMRLSSPGQQSCFLGCEYLDSSRRNSS